MDGDIGFIGTFIGSCIDLNAKIKLTFHAGLGAMGYGMASNIRKKMPQAQVSYIYDVNSLECRKFKEEFESYGKVQIVENAKAATEHSSGVISILPSAVVVRETFLDGITGVVSGHSLCGLAQFAGIFRYLAVYQDRVSSSSSTHAKLQQTKNAVLWHLKDTPTACQSTFRVAEATSKSPPFQPTPEIG